MPFTSETARLYRGPGHRRKRADREAAKSAAEIVRNIIENNAEALAHHFVKRSKKSDRVLVAAIDKLLPEIKPDANGRPIAIQIVLEGQPSTNGAHAPAPGSGNGGPILIGGS